MKEVVLRMFFEDDATAAELAADVAGTRGSGDAYGFRSSANYAVEPMARSFALMPGHVVKLVDAVLTGELSRDDLSTIVFCMEAAPDRWTWDVEDPEGERVSNALFWLGTPEVNYPLTDVVLRKIKKYLETSVNTLSLADTTRSAL